jgi:hypothetical protein
VKTLSGVAAKKGQVTVGFVLLDLDQREYLVVTPQDPEECFYVFESVAAGS